MKVLITGGAGYIGSTVALACRDAGHVAVVLDDLSAGVRAFTHDGPFYEGDIADADLLARVFTDHPDIVATVHCAAFIVVPESVAQPGRYYRNNVAKTVDLVDNLRAHGCTRFIFSSSASIYAPEADFTVDEHSPLAPMSPYARSKAIVEEVLADYGTAGQLSTLSLRYFNPVGADPQLRTGLQIARPTHAVGKLIEAYEDGTTFTVTGVDWPTRDGSGIRDFIHVWDLARAHVAAIERFDDVVTSDQPFRPVNIGTGNGTTVRELVAIFERVVGQDLSVVDGPPRPGDTAGVYTKVDLARDVLGWTAGLSVEQAVADGVAWSKKRAAVIAAG